MSNAYDYDSFTPRRAKFVKTWTPRLVAFGELIDGYDLLVIGVGILYLKPYFGMTPGEVGWLTASAFLGACVGLLVFGKIADKYGRLPIFRWNLIFFIIASIIAALSTNVPILILTRFILGIAVGMDIPVSQAFLAEISSNEQRGRLAGSLPNIMWLLGAISSVLLALIIHPLAGDSSWRWLFGIAALPALFVYLMRRFLPESPRWLLEHGHEEEAMKVFKMLELDPAPALRAIEEKKAKVNQGPVRITGKIRNRVIAVTLFFALQSFAGSVATVTGPEILNDTWAKASSDTTVVTAITQLFGFGLGILAVVIGAVIIDKVDRRKFGIVMCSVLFVLAVGMGVFSKSPVMIAILYVIFSFSTWFGPGVLAWIWAAEAVPTEVRGLGTGIAQTGSRLMIALNGLITPLLAASMGTWRITLYSLAYLVIIGILIGNKWLSTTGQDLMES
ncbi:MAG: MFS transporter [Actinomycetaceae bacterium]|nr:MFS transporter [Actinomycetaceae bacterium]MDY6082509.1 MFS transporter [Actinomycetaceae bacterium]